LFQFRAYAREREFVFFSRPFANENEAGQT
jgi:hypothetical protein